MVSALFGGGAQHCRFFSVTAFASGGEESTESVAEQETAGDVSDLLSALAGSQVTVSVTEDGIQFSSGEK